MSDHDTVACIVLIGDELLNGSVQDTNGKYLIERLRKHGVKVSAWHIIGDDIDQIAETISLEAPRNQWVITSGGVGPTHDDVTMQGIAKAFGVPLETNAFVAELISRHFVGATANVWMKMARLPTTCKTIYIEDIRLPIFWLDNVFILPGIPEIFRLQFAAIEERFVGVPFYSHSIYFQIGEGLLAPKLTEASSQFKGVQFGSYPVLNQDQYRVRVSLESRDENLLTQAMQWLVGQFEPDSVLKLE